MSDPIQWVCPCCDSGFIIWQPPSQWYGTPRCFPCGSIEMEPGEIKMAAKVTVEKDGRLFTTALFKKKDNAFETANLLRRVLSVTTEDFDVSVTDLEQEEDE